MTRIASSLMAPALQHKPGSSRTSLRRKLKRILDAKNQWFLSTVVQTSARMLLSSDNGSMLIRNVALLCVFLPTAFCQNPARILVQGVGTDGAASGASVSGSDYSFSASELALLQQRTITATDHGTPVTFQGVLLTDMLAKVATPTGDKYHHTAPQIGRTRRSSDPPRNNGPSPPPITEPRLHSKAFFSPTCLPRAPPPPATNIPPRGH